MESLNPPAIQAISLRTTGDIFHLPGVDETDGEPAGLKDLIERNPLDTGRFHRHGRHPAFRQPVGNGMQITRKRAKFPDVVLLLLHPVWGDTDPHFFRCHVNSSSIQVDHLQLLLQQRFFRLG